MIKAFNFTSLKMWFILVLTGSTILSYAQTGPIMLYYEEYNYEGWESEMSYVSEIVVDSIQISHAVDLKSTDEMNQILNELEILFDYRMYTIKPEAQKSLHPIVMLMMENPSTRFEVIGYTDARGLYDENMILAEQRATSIINYLVSKGIDPNRLVKKALGEIKLKNGCDSDSYCRDYQHAINRRVEIRLITTLNKNE